MCGINGLIGYKKNSIEQIQKMNGTIVHRGPDAEGIWESDDSNVVFGHRRLSILELSPKGAQPMESISKQYVITFNGEIYNYLSIKKELLKEYGDIEFRGNSDTELLLNAIEYYGIEKTLSMIKGMFAFAVYEKASGNVYIARDRMGEKPLYYGRVAGCIAFASDLGSIEKIEGFDNSINSGILYSYLRSGYIPAPHSIYNDIYKLIPGHFLVISTKSNEWKDNTYWDIKEVARSGQRNPFSGSFAEASAKLESLIKDSIKGQMISDVPLGAFLSGGIDSSLTVALMQSMSDDPIRTFTVGFEDPKYNEAEFAKETAGLLGTDHTEMYVSKQDILDVIDDIPVAYTEPFADSSQIPTMLVSRMTKQHVTVSLSGDAGDEFFCGYNNYKDVQNGLKILAAKLPLLKGDARCSIGRMVRSCGGNSSQLLRTISNVLTVQEPEDWYRCIREDNVILNRLCKDAKQHKDNIDLYENGFLEGAEPNLMMMDMLQYLPDDILVKVDRAGMYYSLESRIPLLDRDVMEFAWILPQEYKYDGNTTKRILRDILYKYVPKEMMDRPKKGFSVPLSEWLRGDELHDWAQDVLSAGRSSMGEYMDYKIVDKMWYHFLADGENEQYIWHLIMLAQWFAGRK